MISGTIKPHLIKNISKYIMTQVWIVPEKKLFTSQNTFFIVRWIKSLGTLQGIRKKSDPLNTKGNPFAPLLWHPSLFILAEGYSPIMMTHCGISRHFLLDLFVMNWPLQICNRGKESIKNSSQCLLLLWGLKKMCLINKALSTINRLRSKIREPWNFRLKLSRCRVCRIIIFILKIRSLLSINWGGSMVLIKL